LAATQQCVFRAEARTAARTSVPALNLVLFCPWGVRGLRNFLRQGKAAAFAVIGLREARTSAPGFYTKPRRTPGDAACTSLGAACHIGVAYSVYRHWGGVFRLSSPRSRACTAAPRGVDASNGTFFLHVVCCFLSLMACGRGVPVRMLSLRVAMTRWACVL
jgi:hypothetical protein